MTGAVLFSLAPHPLAESLIDRLALERGRIESRRFPDGETYLRVVSGIAGKSVILLADLSHPDSKYLALVFLAGTLREMGARSVGLIAPYLPYMRQDRRFVDGEAVTSRLFAADLSRHVDWLVTVDPHLHRFESLAQIYSVPARVVQGAPALAAWLGATANLLLVGPDAESEQWVSGIARVSGHPYVIGRKVRRGDRDVTVTLPDPGRHRGRAAMIIDDVIASGQTILECIGELQRHGFDDIRCAAVHGIFADDSDRTLLRAGLGELATCNSIVHASNRVDLTDLLVGPVRELLDGENKP